MKKGSWLLLLFLCTFIMLSGCSKETEAPAANHGSRHSGGSAANSLAAVQDWDADTLQQYLPKDLAASFQLDGIQQDGRPKSKSRGADAAVRQYDLSDSILHRGWRDCRSLCGNYK